MSNHIRVDVEQKPPMAWCGVRLEAHDWYFRSLDHAAMYGRQMGSVTVCPRCVEAAIDALKRNVEQGGQVKEQVKEIVAGVVAAFDQAASEKYDELSWAEFIEHGGVEPLRKLLEPEGGAPSQP